MTGTESGAAARPGHTRPGRIAVIGSCNVDLITYLERWPRPGETLSAPRFALDCGGKGANQAVAAARLGAEVLMVGRVGQDLFGEATLRNFREAGVDARHVAAVPGESSGVATILVEPSGENAIVIVAGANATLRPRDLDRVAGDLAGCDLILLQLEVPLDTVHHAVALGRRLGVATLLNPAPAVPALDLAQVEGLTFLVPNEHELALLSGQPADSEAAAATAARALLRRGPRHVIVTRGARGALLVTADAVTAIPPTPVTPLDTSGAGDAFIGSFAAFHAGGLALVPALRQAGRYAALSTTRRGTQAAFPTRADFEAFR